MDKLSFGHFYFWPMKKIIFSNSHRRRHFEFFKNMNHPHFAITANVDITNLLGDVRSNKLPFMPTVAWAVAKSANEIPQFRQRIREDEIWEHDSVHPSFAVDTEGTDVFSFCEVKYLPDYQAFIKDAVAKIEMRKTNPSFEDEEGRDDYLFLSSIPWVSFTSIQHAMRFHPHDSIPRITWGKYFSEGEVVKMPLSVQVHHALVDGRHVGQFFEKFENVCNDSDQYQIDTAH